MSSLFISHSSRDNAAAVELKGRLEARGHRSLFLDLDPEKGIQAGASWERTLYTRLRACQAVVALCSHNYLSSHWCFAELALARMEGKTIFALQIDPWKSDGENGTKMPSILTESQYVDLRQEQEAGYERLWHAFEVHGIVPAEHREWGPRDPPYPGLRPFEEQDAPIFFGREKEVLEGVELLTRLRRLGHPRLAMVLGASGSGKSSLVRAGIVPQLRRDPSRWLIVGPIRPGSQPAAKLAAALSRKFEEVGRSRTDEEILDRLERVAGAETGAPPLAAAGGEPSADRLLVALEAFESELGEGDAQAAESIRRLKALIRERSREAPAAPRRPRPPADGNPLTDLAAQLQRGSEASVLLVIDQFEELLGHADADPREPHPANRFMRMLRDALDAEDGSLLVLGTLRADFLEVFQTSPALIGLGFKQLSLGPMSREGMRQVIEQPARLGHIELEEGLAELLLDDTGTSDALPLLAFTLRVMWDRYTDERRRLLGIRDYEELGRLQGAMARVADETLEVALEKGSEEALRDAFLGLARPAAEGSGWSRRPVSWASLGSVQPMIQHFVDQRLLVARPDATVEVAHEALFRSWGKLRAWLDENAEALRLRREIGIAAAKWQQASEDEKEAYVWRKGRLQRAIELRDEGRLALGASELEFLEVSEKTERRARLRKRRRLQALLAAASLAAVAMTVLAILAWLGQRRAEVQAAKALAIQARVAGYPLDQSLLIAVETGRTLERLEATDQLYEARSTLLELLLAYPRLDTFLHGHQDQVSTIAISHDGALLATGGADGKLLLWRERRPVWNLDPCTGTARPPDEPAGTCGRVRRAAFSPGGDLLVASGDQGMVLVWNTSTGQLETRLEAPTPVGGALAVGGDGLVAAGDFKGNVLLWKIPDPTPIELGAHPVQASGEPAWVSQVALTHGGTVLSASVDQSLRLWEVPSDSTAGGGDGGRILCRGDSAIYALRISSSGLVAAGFGDGTLRSWPEDELLRQGAAGGEPVGSCAAGGKKAHGAEIRGLAFSPDGRILATAAEDGTVKVWAADLSELAALGGHSRGAWSVDVGGDGTVATGAGDGMLRLWKSGRAEPRLKKTAQDASLLLIALGDGFAATGDIDGTVRLTSLPEFDDGPTLVPGRGEVTGLAFDPEGRYLATAVDYTVHLWDLAELRRLAPKPLFEDTRHQAWIWGVAFSPDGRRLASYDQEGNVLLWQVPSGESRNLSGPGTSVESLVFDPTGENPVVALGRGDGSVEIRSAETGELVETFPGHEKRVVAVAFSPDGRRLASGSADNTVRVWSAAGGDGSLVLRGHEAQLETVAFSPDGRRIASGDVDGVIRVWDVETGRALFGVQSPEKDILDLAFEKEGWLLSGAADGTFRRWQIGIIDSLDTASRRACRLANRNLYAYEWGKFFDHLGYRRTCPDLPAPAR